MRKLLLILFVFSCFVGRGQETEPVYTDTVDIVDFLESVYKEETKFQIVKGEPKHGYELKNVVITQTSKTTLDGNSTSF